MSASKSSKSVKGGKKARSGPSNPAAGHESINVSITDRTRYRVTGSLFLLALAVIVVPMLFDGEGVPSIEIEPITAPRIEPEVQDLTEVAPASNVTQRVQELRDSVDAEGFMTDSGTRIGEPVLTEVDDKTRVWAVQVGSFTDPDRAMRLRDELRAEGHEAFVSSYRESSRVMTRVAVGPYLSLAGAESLRIRFAEERSLEARVVAFSN